MNNRSSTYTLSWAVLLDNGSAIARAERRRSSAISNGLDGGLANGSDGDGNVDTQRGNGLPGRRAEGCQDRRLRRPGRHRDVREEMRRGRIPRRGAVGASDRG